MISCKFHFLLLWVILVVIPKATYGQNSSTVSGEYSDTEQVQQSLLQKIEGIWISDLYSTENYSGLPYYILIIRNGIVKLDMIGYGYAEILANSLTSNMPKEERTIAQRIEENSSSLYIGWSNERLKVPNQAIASGLGEVGGDVAHEITKQGTSELFGDSFLGELGSDFVSGIVSDIFSSIIYNAFAPSKRIDVLEMVIQQDNEYELSAHTYIQEINIKGEGKPIITKKEQDIRFTKYDPASGVFFDIPFEQKIYVPGDGLLNEIPPRYQEIGKSYLKYYDLRVPTHMSKEIISSQQTIFANTIILTDANPYNILQMKKLQFHNEKRILNLGYEHSVSKPYFGAQMQIKADKKGKKGCYVYNVIPSSPAYLFDIQGGDYILSIDGFEIETPEQAEKYIESMKPFEWVTIRLKRGKKNISVEVELSKK